MGAKTRIATIDYDQPPIALALGAVAVIIAASVVASLAATRNAKHKEDAA